MTRDQTPYESDHPGERAERDRQTRVLITGGISIALLAAGWFVLSHFVMHTAVFDAIAEALGVAFALLVVASLFGAVLSSQGRHG